MGSAANAQDPLKSAECGDALAGLEAARKGGGGQVEAQRQAAARACLGASPAPGRPAREARPPTAIAPPAIAAPAPDLGVRLPAAPPPPAAVAIERPLLPGHCDPSGCWADDGGRLRHIGPPPTLPGGACVLRGGIVVCP
jgi:hypothetical protein